MVKKMYHCQPVILVLFELVNLNDPNSFSHESRLQKSTSNVTYVEQYRPPGRVEEGDIHT